MEKRLTQREWDEIQTVWASGKSTPKQIAKDYSVNIKTLRNKASLNKWKKCGSVAKEAIEEARRELVGETKDSFKDIVKEANQRHEEGYKKIQELAEGYRSLLLEEMFCAIQGDNERLKTIQEVIREITRGKRAYLANSVSKMLKDGIKGERMVLGLDDINHEEQDDTIDQLIASLARARKEKGIKDVPVG